MRKVLEKAIFGDKNMKIGDIIKKIKAEDIPVKIIPEQEQLQLYLRKQKGDVTFDKISKDTNIKLERLLEINNEISIHYRDNLMPKVLYKSMLNTDGDTEFQQFFLRQDVDLGCLFMSKILDIKKNMKTKNTPAFSFLMDNWKKYRGY